MGDYIIDDILDVNLRNELVEFVNNLQSVDKSQLQQIKTEILSEDYISIHKGLYKLLEFLGTEVQIQQFPQHLGIGIVNQDFEDLITQGRLVGQLLHIINSKLSIQSSIDASRILAILFRNNKEHRIYIIESGLMQSIHVLLSSKNSFSVINGLLMVQLSAKISKRFSVALLQTPCTQLICQNFHIHPIPCLKTLYALCTRRIKMKFKHIKQVLIFLCSQVLNQSGTNNICALIRVITGKLIPLPPLKKTQQKKVQLLIDSGLVQRMVQLAISNSSCCSLLCTILTNFILILSGTEEQIQVALNFGIMRVAIKCLDHCNLEIQKRSFAVLGHYSYRPFGAQYFYSQQSIISIMLRKLFDEEQETNLQQLINFFQNLIQHGSMDQLKTLVDQQLIKIIIRHIRFQLSLPNIKLNVSIFQLFQALFERGKHLDKAIAMEWKQDFMKNHGTEVLAQLKKICKSEKLFEDLFEFED